MIKGLVQGVGFRPFIYRLATRHRLYGEVINRSDGVSVIVQGSEIEIREFINDIRKFAPRASRIRTVEVNQRSVISYNCFKISPSESSDEQITDVSPDIAVCSECLGDMENDPGRINYPFVNCTNCGPRFSIIKELPYDRANTTMKEFTMCVKCGSEYHNLLDRRFHAQPVACNICGPEYLYKESGQSFTGIDQILKEVSARIAAGKSIAVKGLGGYHLMCDALNNNAVAELRRKKQRDSKPFAVMFRDIFEIRTFCYTDDAEEKELISWRRPIVILRQKKTLAESVNNGLNTIGAMLPYMPVHYMLFKVLDTPAIVLTSGNLSDEPIIIDDLSAEEHLMPVAGALMSYNREIQNRTDDSVVRINGKSISIIRRSRGFVPRPVDLSCNVEGILAAGAEQKNSFCIGKGHQAIMSQYIGDLKNLPTYDFYTESIGRFSELFRFKPEFIACDLHPDYMSTKYAEKLENDLKIPLIRVQHHHAHIASCMAENSIDEKVIGVSMDGTGYGYDGNIWGSEFLITDLNEFERYTHFDYFRMPGGDKAVDEPWRMAFSCLVNYFGEEINYDKIPLFHSLDKQRMMIVKEMIVKGVNSPLTCGAGRIFDAVSALIGLCSEATFDSEAPMRLESVIDCETDLYYSFSLGRTVSFADTFREILTDITHTEASFISAKFHNTIARIILQVVEKIRKESSLNKVILSGGVFQNKYLLEKTLYLLNMKSFEVFTNHLVPANDGGISLGQLIIASKRSGLCV
ncbi:MAG TPA: carbamoyltransferase HypF [Bacteroidales bacterium]|nr:carbamoyltransferase HypF [Bacteroidales bacterium]